MDSTLNQIFFKAIDSLGLNRINSNCEIVSRTPKGITLKITNSDIIFFVKALSEYSSFLNETIFSSVSYGSFVPNTYYLGQSGIHTYPYLVIRDGSNLVSLGHSLLQKKNLSKYLVGSVAECISEFHFNKQVNLNKKRFHELFECELKYFIHFTENNKEYLDFVDRFTNDSKAKKILFHYSNSFYNFSLKLKELILNNLERFDMSNLDEANQGNVHGDLWAPNILFDKKEKNIKIIDFSHSHYGNIYIDLVRFKQRGTQMKPYYSVDELNVSKYLWSTFCRLYRHEINLLHNTSNFLELQVSQYLLLRTINHYLDQKWIVLVDSCEFPLFFSKLLRQSICLFRLYN